LVTSSHGPINQVMRRFMHEKFIRNCEIKFQDKSDFPLLGNSQGYSKFSKRFGDVRIIEAPKYVDFSDDETECLMLAFPLIKLESILTVAQAKVRSLLIKSELFENAGNVCTHVAKFSDGNHDFYGVIIRIIVAGDVFALCREFTVLHRLVDKIAKPSHPLLCSLLRDDEGRATYGNFFYIVKKGLSCRLVKLDMLLCRCILINLSDSLVLIEELMEYEHN